MPAKLTGIPPRLPSPAVKLGGRLAALRPGGRLVADKPVCRPADNPGGRLEAEKPGGKPAVSPGCCRPKGWRPGGRRVGLVGKPGGGCTPRMSGELGEGLLSLKLVKTAWGVGEPGVQPN